LLLLLLGVFLLNNHLILKIKFKKKKNIEENCSKKYSSFSFTPKKKIFEKNILGENFIMSKNNNIP